jgi:hypothetical protein
MSFDILKSNYITVVATAETELTTADLDTGAGTDTRAVVGIAKAESGGATLVGSASPMPISGPVTVASGGIASGAVASGAVASGAVVDGAVVTLGAKTDAKSTATDGTSVTAMQVLKQISASTQAALGVAAPVIDSYSHFAVNLNAGNDQQLVAGAANKQIWVYGIVLTLSVAGTICFQDSDDAALTGVLDYTANSGPHLAPTGNFNMPLFKCTTAKALEVDVVTAAIDGWIDYAIVSV